MSGAGDVSQSLFVATLGFPATPNVPVAGEENLLFVVHGSESAARRIVDAGAHASVLIARRTGAAGVHTPQLFEHGYGLVGLRRLNRQGDARGCLDSALARGGPGSDTLT